MRIDPREGQNQEWAERAGEEVKMGAGAIGTDWRQRERSRVLDEGGRRRDGDRMEGCRVRVRVGEGGMRCSFPGGRALPALSGRSHDNQHGCHYYSFIAPSPLPIPSHLFLHSLFHSVSHHLCCFSHSQLFKSHSLFSYFLLLLSCPSVPLHSLKSTDSVCVCVYYYRNLN